MTKSKVNLVALSTVLVCICFAVTHLRSPVNEIGAAMTAGMDEDADGRAEYELMMLRDPETGMIPAHIREKELLYASTLPSDRNIKSGLGKTTASTLTFQPRGPWNVGGRTRAFGIDAGDENKLIAGTCAGGMWRSVNGGISWQPATIPITSSLSVSCLAQDTRPGHTHVWYYGTGEAYGASASGSGAYYLGNGVYKSTDSGKTWNVLTSTTSSAFTSFDAWGDLIWNIVTDSSTTTADVVYAAAYGGIYRSADGGATWGLVLGTFSSTSQSYFTDVAVSRTGIVYATLSSDGPRAGLYRSTDGITFTNITPTGFAGAYNRIKIGISPSNENQVYFLGNTPGYGNPDTSYSGSVEWNSLWRYTYVSGDGSGTGGNWQDRSANLPTSGGPFDKFMSQGSYDLVIKVKPNDTNVVYIGGTNLYRSVTAFADNSHTTYIGGYKQGDTLPIIHSYANHHPDQHEVAFYRSNPDVMISTNDGGIFKTTDNTASVVNWTPLNNGYLTSMFYTCAIDHASTSDIITGGAQDNGSWYTDNTSLTSPWVTPRGGDGSYCAIADNSTAYYFSIQSGKMMKARLNAAGGVDSFARIDPIGGSGYSFINPYILDPNNTNIMYLAGGRALWRNNNLAGIPYAANWDTIATNWVKFPDSMASALSITALAASKSPANRLYFGTNQRKVYRVDNANVGTPTPRDITSVTTGNIFPAGNVSCIAVDPNNADHVMVAFSNYNIYSIYYSTDGGTTWGKSAGNLEAMATGGGNGPSIRWLSIIPVTGGIVYLAGTSVGLFATTELNGISTVWVQIGANTIGNSVVDMMDYRSTDGLLVVATHSAGIFSTHLTDITEVNAITEAAIRKPVLQLSAYPNPATATATIEFELPFSAQATLMVTDDRGRLIRMLENDHLEQGKHQYTFNRGDLPAGMYYFTLRTGTLCATRKLEIL